MLVCICHCISLTNQNHDKYTHQWTPSLETSTWLIRLTLMRLLLFLARSIGCIFEVTLRNTNEQRSSLSSDVFKSLNVYFLIMTTLPETSQQTSKGVRDYKVVILGDGGVGKSGKFWQFLGHSYRSISLYIYIYVYT